MGKKITIKVKLPFAYKIAYVLSAITSKVGSFHNFLKQDYPVLIFILLIGIALVTLSYASENFIEKRHAEQGKASLNDTQVQNKTDFELCYSKYRDIDRSIEYCVARSVSQPELCLTQWSQKRDLILGGVCPV
jgi:hypothetical protein